MAHADVALRFVVVATRDCFNTFFDQLMDCYGKLGDDLDSGRVFFWL